METLTEMCSLYAKINANNITVNLNVFMFKFKKYKFFYINDNKTHHC